MPLRVKPNGSVFVFITTAPRIEPEVEIELVVARAAPCIHHADAARDIQGYFVQRTKGSRCRGHERRAADRADGIAARADDAAGRPCRQHRPHGRRHRRDEHHADLGAKRRCEIGVRGANRGDIQRQFLAEALILTLSGSILGVVIGNGTTYGICQYFEWDFFLSPTSIIAGVGVSTVVGVFFSFQPAYQASSLDPIVAPQGDEPLPSRRRPAVKLPVTRPRVNRFLVSPRPRPPRRSHR